MEPRHLYHAFKEVVSNQRERERRKEDSCSHGERARPASAYVSDECCEHDERRWQPIFTSFRTPIRPRLLDPLIALLPPSAEASLLDPGGPTFLPTARPLTGASPS